MTCLLTLEYLFDVLKGSTFTKEFDAKSMMIGHVGTHMFALQQRWRCFGKQKKSNVCREQRLGLGFSKKHE